MTLLWRCLFSPLLGMVFICALSLCLVQTWEYPMLQILEQIYYRYDRLNNIPECGCCVCEAKLILSSWCFSLFWSFRHVVWPWPGCLIPMPARGLGLNLGYAKNEASRGSRHHSLVFYPVKTISSSYVFLSFFLWLSYFLTLSPAWPTPPPATSPGPSLCFFIRECVDPFFSRSQSGELEDEVFNMAQKSLCHTYSDVCGLA